MYVLPICLLIMAVVFLMIQIRYFLIHYKQASEVEPSKLNVYIYIYINYCGLISSLSVAVLSIIYVFILNNQL